MDNTNQFAQSPSSDKGDKSKDSLPLLLVTTVDIGGGLSGKIELHRGDEPLDAAKAFCIKHNLPSTIVEPLTLHLIENLKKASKSPDQKSSPSTEGKSPEKAPEVQNDTDLKEQEPEKNKADEAKEEFSFGNGVDDDKLYQKLSSKLLPVDETRLNKDNVMSAADFVPSTKRKDPNRSSRNQFSYSVNSAEPRRDTVYNRLYIGALDRIQRLEEKRKIQEFEAMNNLRESKSSIGWISAEMMKSRGKGYENYGEMLYAKGLEVSESKKSKAELYKSQELDKEMKGVTFKPNVTKKAHDLKYKDSSSDDSGDEMWQRLHSRGMRKSTADRLETLRRQREMEEISECTFRPRINKTSESLMAQRSETLKILNISHYDQLFQDAIRRQKKSEEMSTWFPDEVTFHPIVNNDGKAKEYVRRSWDKLAKDPSVRQSLSALGIDPSASNPSVVDRLYASLKKRDAKIEETRAKFHGSVDPVTGKELYRPEINRNAGVVAARRNPDGKNIGEHLYQVAKDIAQRHRQQEMREVINAAIEANKPRSTATSQNMFLKLKLKRFGQIFDYLDESSLGLVDLISVVRARGGRLDNLDPEVLADVETAASVWAHANGTSLDVWPEEEEGEGEGEREREREKAKDGSYSGGGGRGGMEGSSPGKAANSGSSRASTPSGAPVACPPLNLEQFVAVMEQALILRRGPRSYLVPSPAVREVDDPSFKPSINKKSKELAARLRPDDESLYDLLYKVAEVTREKLEVVRREKEDEELRQCTFHPQLNANSRAVDGRALRLSMNASARYAAQGPLGPVLAVDAANGIVEVGVWG
eukprot:CAMPEP_0175073044 /NCGR_PEP_ID=MMETSP0052_2-20121109/20299_1 /TAXON_ID=51329 ORGANISM="Polytomella parva, Strain SAG 63-3" /NCGR_SAMPLE_ID=MMETSP0052_2 /ASSEMBLY_ACC=CAM_ASM_000194 /LENGTH=814 /DNA_ID=CAMNT_0016340721 /DNA_START=84 /DNA_END=2525 /DNA_ORIENTATION=-